jgi:hypothetical protein
MDGTAGVVWEAGLTMKAFLIFKTMDLIIAVLYISLLVSYALHRLHALIRQRTD